MDTKTLVWIGLVVGGLLGSWIASLLGMDLFSLSGAVISAIGSILGIWLGYTLGSRYF